MVYLHGGGYVLGGGVSYFFGPQLLVEKDVVLVTVQYRLGALGETSIFCFVLLFRSFPPPIFGTGGSRPPRGSRLGSGHDPRLSFCFQVIADNWFD